MSEYHTHVDQYCVRVDKVGGGTVGKSYDGLWEVVVKEEGIVILDDTIQSLRPMTHYEVAEFAPEFIDDADEV